MENLHPGARWLFRISSYLGLIVPLIVLIVFVIPGFTSLLGSIIPTIIIAFVIFLILFIFIAEIFTRLAYNNWKFEFTNAELKIEKGIIWKTYKSIPYERVQNVEIHRGILARMLGFSKLNIHTAGYSGGYQRRGGSGAEGSIPAVEAQKAEQLRKFLVSKISKKGL